MARFSKLIKVRTQVQNISFRPLSDDLRRQTRNLAPPFFFNFLCNDAQYSIADWLSLFVDQYAGIVVESNRRAVFPF